MPLGRKQSSAFRKTVSDLKSAVAGDGGGGRPRKRKLSDPGAEEAAPAPAPAPASRRQGLPRMGRSLANLASSIKKRGKRLQPPSAQVTATEQPEEAMDADADENDDGHHDSTIFEEVPPPPPAQKKQKKSQEQQQKPQQPQQPPPTKKERRILKKQQKKNADLVSELLTLWEELRVDATPDARVAELCDSAMKIGRGKLAELAASHDTGRVLEAVLKRGGERHRRQVFEELKEHLLPLAKSKYGRFVAVKLLKYGTKEQRIHVFRCLEGRAAELLKHRFASELVEAAYNEFANAAQRAGILQEFYGPEVALFKSDGVCKLKDALAKRPGLVMQHLQQHLLALTQKDLVRHSLVQHLLLEFLEATAAGTAAADPTGAASLLENLRDNLVPMLHTRDGAKAALLVVRRLSAKDLKRALKSMKTYLCTSACNEHGYLFVIGLLECPSPTPEELHKLLLRELFDSLQELVDSPHGRKVLLYLLCPRDPVHFPPQLMALIRPDETISTEQLRLRLHQALVLSSAKLLSHVSGRMAELCQANATILFVMDTLRHCPGEKSACYAALADLIRQPFSSAGEARQQDESKQHIIERSAGHLMLKRLLPTCPDLVRLINDFATDENIQSWLTCNRGSFFILQLFDSCPEDCNLRDRISGQFTAERLLVCGHKGAQLLAEKLQQPITQASAVPKAASVGRRSTAKQTAAV